MLYTIWGSKVTNIQLLTKISVLSLGEYFMVIDFHYDTGNIRRLGCQNHQLSAYKTSEFSVDSAQGEFIKTVETDIDSENIKSFWRRGRLRSFKVSRCSPGPKLSDYTLKPYLELGLIDLYQSRTTSTFPRRAGLIRAALRTKTNGYCSWNNSRRPLCAMGK